MSELLRIATRQSPLALWQARHVADRLKAAHPGLEVELLELSTEGDRFLSASLAAVGGKGLFVKEIEQALFDGRADLAVHSLKDMTSTLPEGLMLAAVPEREDPRDALIAAEGVTLETLPFRARVGTASQRRSCLLRERRPDLEIVTVRGNVQTRLRKLEELGLDGLVLAYAGLKRMGLEGRVSQILPIERSLPAVGQGVLGIECRVDDARTRRLLEPLEDPTTRHAVRAERAFLSKLEGGCTVPMAGHATIEGDRLRLQGLVGRPDGTLVLRDEVEGSVEEAEALGQALAGRLLEQGAADILAVHGHVHGRPDAATPPQPKAAGAGRLSDLTVWVTRPRERAEALCFLLEDEGASVISLPLLELLPPEDDRPLRAAASQVQRYRWILFTSPAGVEALVEACRREGSLERLGRVKLGAVGPQTALSMRSFGLKVEVEAVDPTGPGLFEVLKADLQPNDDVLLPVAQQARPELHRLLTEAGVQVTRVVAYRAEQILPDAAALRALDAAPSAAIVLGSPRTVEALISTPSGRAIAERSRLISIGTTTSGAIEAAGLTVAATAKAPTPEGLLEAVVVSQG